jgi:hypothetical protein
VRYIFQGRISVLANRYCNFYNWSDIRRWIPLCSRVNKKHKQHLPKLWKEILLSFVNVCLPKNNRCYENYVYLSNISIRLCVLLAYPQMLLNTFTLLSVFIVNSLVMLLLFFYFSLYQCIWLYKKKDIYSL